MTAIQIRPASIEDADTLAALSGQLGSPSIAEDIAGRLSLVLERDDRLTLVAKKNGKVVGWLHAFIAFRVESPAFAEIGELVVAESERGQGIGRLLVGSASQWAHSKGLQNLRVRSNMIRKNALAFYLHIGFQELKNQTVFSMATPVD